MTPAKLVKMWAKSALKREYGGDIRRHTRDGRIEVLEEILLRVVPMLKREFGSQSARCKCCSREVSTHV